MQPKCHFGTEQNRICLLTGASATPDENALKIEVKERSKSKDLQI
jgi:hypothetical protein